MMTLLNAIITGIFTVVAGVLSALVSRYGPKIFWEPGKKMVLSGRPITSKLIDRDGNLEEYPNTDLAEQYDNPILTIRGKRATFEATYTSKSGEETEVSGKITAKGRYDNGQAHLTYKISDAGRSQEWSGVLMLYVPGMGDLTGFYLVESSLYPGHTAFGYVKLKRVSGYGA